MRERNSHKRASFLFICLIGLSLPGFLYAQIVISEVMYDVEGTDTGREWIEVHNEGTEAIDFSLWKLFEANTAHKITAVGSSLLSPGGFAILADVPDKFLADHSGFQGLIFDTTFSLNNAGETIALRDPSGGDVDSLSYLPAWGAAGDTFSLQRTSDGRWIATAPTPGGATTASESSPSPAADAGNPATQGSDDTDTGDEPIVYASYSSQSVANTKPDSSELEVTSGRPRLGFVGMPLEFQAKVRKSPAGAIDMEHSWSMGDGGSKYGSPVSYTYRFPGDYTVILNSRTKETSAVSKTKVKIVQPDISISAANSDYIEISNASEYEVNIGGMVLRTNGDKMMISDDTIIAPHSSLRLPSSSTKLGALKDFVSLDSSLGNNFAMLHLAEPSVLLPEGASIEDIRAWFIKALKIYGK